MRYIGEKGLRLASGGAGREQLRVLPERWQRIVEWNFGLDGDGPLTYSAIGARLGISRQAVHQMRTKALKRMARGAHAPTS